MQITSFLPHYQLVCMSFDISSFSLISYSTKAVSLHHKNNAFNQYFILTNKKWSCKKQCNSILFSYNESSFETKIHQFHIPKYQFSK